MSQSQVTQVTNGHNRAVGAGGGEDFAKHVFGGKYTKFFFVFLCTSYF